MASTEIKGGEKLNRALETIAMSLGVGSPHQLKVGFLEGASYPDGTPVAMIAAIHNFGAPAAGIPPRPFMSDWVRDKSDGWPKAIAKNLKATNYNAVATLELVGKAMEGQLQQVINSFSGVPLKEATIRRKGFSKQLIDTSYMVNHVGSEVT